MNNIDKFDILVGKVLAKLYGEFPIKCELVPEEFEVEYGFLKATVEFLVDNGMIVAKDSSVQTYYNATLTLKGLQILKMPVDEAVLG